MKWAGSKPVPWTGWNDFTAWAASFSLRMKVLGGVLGVVVLVGLGTSLIGTRMAREMIMDQYRARLLTDLATAGFVLENARKDLLLNIRRTAASEQLKRLFKRRDLAEVRNRLAIICVENELDFLSVTDDQGRVLSRAYAREVAGEDLSKDPVINSAIGGTGMSGIRQFSSERLYRENPNLRQQISNETEQRGLVIEAAQPLMIDDKVAGTLYGGTLLNNNNHIVDRISQLVFKGLVHGKRDIGHVTIYEGRVAVSTTLKGGEGLPLLGFEADPQIVSQVLTDGKSTLSRESRLGDAYLSASEPIKDTAGKIVGAIQLATRQKPITSVIDRLVVGFLVVALIGVLLMGAITYFLVKWISRPLEDLLAAARAVAEGDLSHEVPVIARDELGELAQSFNLMVRNLAISQNKLEEWGKQLASKVALQTGELQQAQEQVARVKKLASLEKMADGMAHHLAHISDPLGVAAPDEDEAQGAATRILLFDHDENTLDVCRRTLENEGFEVAVARSVEEALNELQQEFVDVMVAEVDVPDMSGREFFKEIRYRQPEVLVILTAPFKATEEAVELVKLGAFDYLPKPFGPHQITLMVYTALRTKAAVDSTRREHAQQRAETIFQRLPVALALADEAHRVVYNNRAFVELASATGHEVVGGKTFKELFGVDPLERSPGDSRWVELTKVGRTAKLYNFKLPDEDLRVLMLVDITDTVRKDQEADVFKAETLTRAQQVIHQQMRVAQEIAGLLGETTAETKAALYELIKLAGESDERERVSGPVAGLKGQSAKDGRA